MSESTFMGYRCTFHVRPDSKIHREHNIREPQLIKHEKHIDKTHYSETTLDLGTLDQAYETIFKDAIASYNKGKRKDRQIKNYLELIRKDNRRGKHKNQRADGSRKAAYEAYITIGNRDNQPNHEEAKKILKLFVEKWIPSHYKQIKPILISYHDDEFSIDEETGEKIKSPIHCHLDFIYIADCLTPEEQKAEKLYRKEQKEKKILECQKNNIPFDEKAWQKIDWQEDLVRRTGKSLTSGLPIQSSMSAALMQMGFKTSKGKGTAQTQFEEQIRHDLQDFAESMGLKIDRTPGVKHQHEEKNIFQLKKDNEKKENRLNQKELELNKKTSEIDSTINKLTEVKNFYTKKEKEQNMKNKIINQKVKEVALQQNEVSYREKKLNSKEELMDYYENVYSEVQKRHLTITEAENNFNKTKNKKSLGERLKTFISDCKNLVTSLVLELGYYKRAFKHFWKSGSDDFRNLANKMDKEHCKNYKLYFDKSSHNLLSENINNTIMNHQKYLSNKTIIENNFKKDR